MRLSDSGLIDTAGFQSAPGRFIAHIALRVCRDKPEGFTRRNCATSDTRKVEGEDEKLADDRARVKAELLSGKTELPP